MVEIYKRELSIFLNILFYSVLINIIFIACFGVLHFLHWFNESF